MRNRYTIVIERSRGSAIEAQTVRSFKNSVPAVRLAEAIARRVSRTTRHLPLPACVQVRQDGECVHECEPTLVPSVGEVGWW